jgi:hypothetical protein
MESFEAEGDAPTTLKKKRWPLDFVDKGFGQRPEAAYAAAESIRKSSIRLPDSSCTVSHCGCLPRPAHVSDGRVGLRYFGNTGG